MKTMRMSGLKLALVMFLVLCGVALRAPLPVHAATITVNTTNDEFDTTPNTTCSLREAIESANTGTDFGGCTITGSGTVTINLPAGTFTLTRTGINEDNNQTGDLDIASTLIISGVGAEQTIINGGAIDRVLHILTGGDVTLQNLTVTGGNVGIPPNSTGGGGILHQGTSLTILNSTIRNNTLTGTVGGGGGILHTNGTLTIISSTIRHNSAVTRGGGIYSSGSAGSTTISQSTLNDNASSGDGGGAIALENSTSVVNTTFSAHSAATSGGAIWVASSSGSLTVNNSTFYNNTSFNGRHIRNQSSTAAILRNTIITGTPSGTACTGSYTSSNVLSDTTGCGVSITLVTNFDTNLNNNGGPTLTHAILPGSNAIDAGDNLTCAATDQRGLTRPVDYDLNSTATCDVGAFERQAAETFTATVNDGDTVSFGATLTSIEDISGGNAPGQVTVTRINQPPGGGTPDPGEMPFHVNINAATNTGLNINLTLCYTDWELTHNTTGVVEANLSLYRWDGSAWVDQGVDVLDTTNNCATKNNVSDLSSWTLASGPSAPTAVFLQTFQGSNLPPLFSLVMLLALLLLTAVLLWRRRTLFA